MLQIRESNIFLFIFIDTRACFEYNKSTKINTSKRTLLERGIDHVSCKICKCPG